GRRPMISPDGHNIAFRVGTTDGDFLAVRPNGVLEAKVIAGTKGALQHFWSPDGRSLAFVSEGKLKTIDLAGGPAAVICEVAPAFGGTWNGKGKIVLGSRSGGLREVSLDTGAVRTVTPLVSANRDTAYDDPIFLPD